MVQCPQTCYAKQLAAHPLSLHAPKTQPTSGGLSLDAARTRRVRALRCVLTVLPTCANCGMISGSNMKTAISIDDGLLQEADETARLMGLSRSRLFSVAVGDFLKRQREEQMLHRL